MKFVPHAYQQYAIEYIKTHPVTALLLDMGLGKTVTTLTAIRDLMQDTFEVQRVLVVAPLRVARDTWPEEIRKWYHQHHTEEGLARTYAVASNNFWWGEDEAYDFEEGTPEYQETCRITDAWGNLSKELEVEIFSLLKNESWEIPESGTLEVLVPFMVRNGYYYNIGWWEPKEE